MLTLPSFEHADGNLDVQPNGLLLFGYGDGGGGPTETHIHNLRRARAAHNNGYTDIPKVQLANSLQDFYDTVLETTEGGKRLPTWQGDLYLEFHRGVYTSHGSIKRWNRKLEVKLHNVEWAATLASLANKQYTYPKESLDELWHGVLFLQFHDILPGSSIRMVYEDAENDYACIDKKLDKLLVAAQEVLVASSILHTNGSAMHSYPEYSGTKPRTCVALNTLGDARLELMPVPLDASPYLGAAVQEGAAQVVATPQGREALIVMRDEFGSGFAVFDPTSNRDLTQAITENNLEARAWFDAHTKSYVLSNGLTKIVIQDGRITSLYDQKLQRELLRAGQTAGLTVSEDYPADYDAWELELYSLDTTDDLKFDSVEVEDQGPLRASLLGRARFGQSHASVKISLDAGAIITPTNDRGNARVPVVLDFQVTWHEKHRILRFNVPTNLVSDLAAYETQFGITHRPTGRNTSWDAAKFEGCAHRFVDLSETGYGLALLSESKYGFSVEGGTMRASLLRAATYPDAHQDEGRHAFSLALLPHVGRVENPSSGVIQRARAFNNPLQLAPHPQDEVVRQCSAAYGCVGDKSQGLGFDIRPSENSVILDTIKRGEADFVYHRTPASGKTTVVARVYEPAGAHAHAYLSVRGVKVSKVRTASILEDVQDELSPSSEGYGISLRPYEVKTLVLEVA